MSIEIKNIVLNNNNWQDYKDNYSNNKDNNSEEDYSKNDTDNNLEEDYSKNDTDNNSEEDYSKNDTDNNSEEDHSKNDTDNNSEDNSDYENLDDNNEKKYITKETAIEKIKENKYYYLKLPYELQLQEDIIILALGNSYDMLEYIPEKIYSKNFFDIIFTEEKILEYRRNRYNKFDFIFSYIYDIMDYETKTDKKNILLFFTYFDSFENEVYETLDKLLKKEPLLNSNVLFPLEYLNDKELILKIVGPNYKIYNYLPEKLKKDADIINEYLLFTDYDDYDDTFSEIISLTYLNDKELVLKIIKDNKIYKYLPDNLKSDWIILDKIFRNLDDNDYLKMVINYLPKQFKKIESCNHMRNVINMNILEEKFPLNYNNCDINFVYKIKVFELF